MKKIAWGFSKIFQIHVQETDDAFDYCIDSSPVTSDFAGIPIHTPEVLDTEALGSFRIVIFAVTNSALVAISSILANRGLVYGRDFEFYSDYLWPGYKEKMEHELNLTPSADNYVYAKAYTFNSRKPIHTTILGTHLFLEMLRVTKDLQGAIAEVGAFEGGNAYCALNFPAYTYGRPYYILDSFEGFPELHPEDPSRSSKGDYKPSVSYNEILRDFSIFPQAKVLKGFVPEVFSEVREDVFSLVFYDCDLYQPALDTFAFFWEKLVPGGILLIHDYEHEEGGFRGVRSATKQFFGSSVKLTSFPQNTMAVIQK